jgi:hypothetical protein
LPQRAPEGGTELRGGRFNLSAQSRSWKILFFGGAGFTGGGKTRSFVILSEAKNLCFFCFLVLTIEARFFASLRMTK